MEEITQILQSVTVREETPGCVALIHSKLNSTASLVLMAQVTSHRKESVAMQKLLQAVINNNNNNNTTPQNHL